MISLAFKYDILRTTQPINTISEGLMTSECAIAITSVAFNWIKEHCYTFVKGYDEYGEYGYVITSKYGTRIKVYNSNSMYRQIASHSGFEALKKELGSLYRPYDENDYTVELYIRS